MWVYRMALTDSKLKAMLKGHEDKTPRKVADRDGLGVLWRPSGVVSWVFRYRWAGKAQNVTLGQYPALPLAAARAKAAQCKAWLAGDRDPATEIKLDRDEKRAPVTVRDALGYWVENYAKQRRKNYERLELQLEKWIYPRIGDLPLADCETRHWLAVFDVYRAVSPVGSGYGLQMCKQALKFCRVRRYALEGTRALEDLTITDAGERQGKRDRVLTLEELRDVWSWCSEPTTNRYYGNLVALVVAFGARTQEVRLSRPGEWDLDAGAWTVPAEHSKSGSKIIRPIPSEVRPLVEILIAEKGEYLLGELKTPEAVAMAGRRIAGRLGHPAWTLHDLRRSMATHLTAKGVAPHVIELMLGHTLPGVAAHYIHDCRLEEQREAQKIWLGALCNRQS